MEVAIEMMGRERWQSLSEWEGEAEEVEEKEEEEEEEDEARAWGGRAG